MRQLAQKMAEGTGDYDVEVHRAHGALHFLKWGKTQQRICHQLELIRHQLELIVLLDDRAEVRKA
jgi:hypothetical protein